VRSKAKFFIGFFAFEFGGIRSFFTCDFRFLTSDLNLVSLYFTFLTNSGWTASSGDFLRCSTSSTLGLGGKVGHYIIEGKIFNFCIINREYLSPITLNLGVYHHCCQGEGIAVVESTSLVVNLIAVCSQLRHWIFTWVSEGRPSYSPITGSSVYSLIIPC
jgi:hypothetical protein